MPLSLTGGFYGSWPEGALLGEAQHLAAHFWDQLRDFGAADVPGIDHEQAVLEARSQIEICPERVFSLLPGQLACCTAAPGWTTLSFLLLGSTLFGRFAA